MMKALFAEPGDPLTSREYEVMALYARFGLRKEVASRLGISTHSVQDYLIRAYRKLDVHDGISAFHALGWLRIPTERDIGKYAALHSARLVEIKLRHLRAEVDRLLEQVAA